MSSPVKLALYALICAALIAGIFFLAASTANQPRGGADSETSRQVPGPDFKGPTAPPPGSLGGPDAPPEETPRCLPLFAVTHNPPQLTQSEIFAAQCVIQKTRSACEGADIYHAARANFGSPDGVPDCRWTDA